MSADDIKLHEKSDCLENFAGDDQVGAGCQSLKSSHHSTEGFRSNSHSLTHESNLDRSDSKIVTGFVMLHSYFFIFHCGLYRVLFPDIRECVSPAAWQATPNDKIDYC